MTILITGSEGLVGSALRRALAETGEEPRCLDLASRLPATRGDVRSIEDVGRAVTGCRGIVHLAAVSRVVWAQRDPGLCESVNVAGCRTVVRAALAAPNQPWIVFASSREVYGQQLTLPVPENAELRPMNVYARSKASGERMIREARSAGARTAVLRFSSVYGSADDHKDRVVPCFARAALCGGTLSVEGGERCFDFTHVDDVVRGVRRTIEVLDHGDQLPDVHLVSGVPTTLQSLAERCIRLGGNRSSSRPREPREYDVARFWGDTSRARSLLGWSSRISLDDGLARLCGDFTTQLVASEAA